MLESHRRFRRNIGCFFIIVYLNILISSNFLEEDVIMVGRQLVRGYMHSMGLLIENGI